MNELFPQQVPRLTAIEIKQGIREAYAKGYKTFFEVGNGTGAGVTTHADAVTFGIWPSTGFALFGFEVKVSRQDFLAEMKNPLKSMPVFQYCNRWWLATPPGLVQADELPETWGLKTYDGKTLRTVKAAPALSPVPMTREFMAALIRRAGEKDLAVLGMALEKQRKELETKFERELDRRLGERRSFMSHAGAEALQIVERFQTELGEEWHGPWDVEDVLQGIKLARAARMRGWDSVNHLAGELIEAHERLVNAMALAGIEYKPPEKKR